ncbi:DNA polymerase-4 [Anseongella ginsenosidimutans]|uniref:DNA polymerase IV n=2 Tax=Anseongella ginsenosidimutans TaxID=496056 RepID=A0A4R3KNT2_9SPHI|nr:DNA polymerase-4 [Anseongella ginsenosidimutans]
MHRKIIHIDMDAFYASVEQRDFPEYRGKPIVVGGPPQGRGVVATASYEARKFGVRSAMPSKKALELCPEALFVFPRFDVYKEVSAKIREIFRRYTDIIEPLSLDEAYLDVTEDKKGIGSALEIAGEIRQAIKEELQLTASAGVSVNKFVAKIASDIQKPDGLTFIGPSRIEAFMEQLPVEKFFGVGKVTAGKMKQMGLHTGGDLKKLSEEELVRHFGKTGRFYYKIVRGIDEREVQPSREIKSISIEDTFARDLAEPADLLRELDRQAEKLSGRLEKRMLKGKTLTLKLKFTDFKQVTRSRSLPEPFCDALTIRKVGADLLAGADLQGKAIRLLGLGISNFNQPDAARPVKRAANQLDLFL